jgi:hypothetical protein
MNTNLLSLTGFKLSIDSNEYKNTEYFATSASFPSVSLTEVAANYRNNQGFVPGDRLIYDPITIRIAVDENLNAYREMFDWMVYNTKNDNLKSYDILLSFISSHNNISQVIRLVRAFPTALSGMEFNVQSTETEYAFVDVTFRYDYFEFVKSNI